MQDIEKLTFDRQLTQSLNNSRLKDANLDQVTLHCRRDHLSPSFHQSNPSSSYQSSYSPTKTPSNYNQPELQKGLYRFRKYQNSTTLLPQIQKVSEHSHYQKSYNPHSVEKDPKGQEKGSHFLKMSWALDPTSNYKKDFISRQASKWNKDNAQRPQYNKLAVFKLQNSPKRDSNYRTEFKPFTIKKQAEFSVKQKDHIKSNSKQNVLGQLSISEYQRRYDSVMERTKNTNSSLGLYMKGSVVKRSK